MEKFFFNLSYMTRGCFFRSGREFLELQIITLLLLFVYISPDLYFFGVLYSRPYLTCQSPLLSRFLPVFYGRKFSQNYSPSIVFVKRSWALTTGSLIEEAQTGGLGLPDTSFVLLVKVHSIGVSSTKSLRRPPLSIERTEALNVIYDSHGPRWWDVTIHTQSTGKPLSTLLTRSEDQVCPLTHPPTRYPSHYRLSRKGESTDRKGK